MLHASLDPVIEALRAFSLVNPCKDAGKMASPEFKADHFEKWKFDIEAVLEASNILHVVKQMIESEGGKRIFPLKPIENARTVGPVANRQYVYESSDDSGVTWVNTRLNKKQIGDFLLIGIQLKAGKLNPHADDLLYKNRAKLIPEILMIFEKHYGKNKTADKMSVVLQFSTKRRIPPQVCLIL